MTVSFKHIRMPLMTAVVMSAIAGGVVVHAPAYATPSQAQQWDNEGAVLGGVSSATPVAVPAARPAAPPVVTEEKSGGWFGWFSSDDDDVETGGRITTDVMGADVVTPDVTVQQPVQHIVTETPPAPEVQAGVTEEKSGGWFGWFSSDDDDVETDGRITTDVMGADVVTPDVTVQQPVQHIVTETPPAPELQAGVTTHVDDDTQPVPVPADVAPVQMIPAAVVQEQQALRDIEDARQAVAAAPVQQHSPVRAEESIADAAADKGETSPAVAVAETTPPVEEENIVWSKAGVPAQPEAAPLPMPAPPPDLAVLQQESLSALVQDNTALASAVAVPPAVAPVHVPVPVRDAIRTALAVNPDVRRTAAARDMLEAALRDTQGQTRPQVSMFGSLSGSYDTSKEKSNRFDDSVFAKTGLRANWQLYSFGAATARIRAGEESVTRGDLDLIDRRETTAFEVLAIYIEALRQREMLEIETFRIVQHEDFLKMTEEAARAEQVLGSQLLLARTGLDQKKQAYMNAERSLQEMFFALERMTDVRLELSQLSVPFTPLVVLPEEDEFITRSIDDAPEVKALQAAVAAQRNELAGARKDRFGNVSLNASVAGDRNLIESDDGTQASGDLALEYSVPLYTGGSMQARIDRASGALVQAEADLQKTRLQLREQLRLAYFSIQQNEDILRAARNEEDAAMATLEAYRGEVAYGGRAFSDIIMQIDNVSSARARAVSARYAKMLAAYAVVRRQNGLLHYFNLRP